MKKCISVLENRLTPEINKLRLIRELLINPLPAADFEGYRDEGGKPLEGLFEILLAVTRAYDAAFTEIKNIERG